MGRDRDIPDWIGNIFDNYEVKCPDGSKWKFDKKISEKSCGIRETDPDDAVAESQAVYHCHQIKGPSVGMEAIVKVRMQVPSTYPENPNPFVRAREALRDEVASPTAQEIDALDHLAKMGCTVAPRLLHRVKMYQDICMLVPGAYIMILIMEKCPGVVLTDFWDYDEAKREKIRKAFRRDYTKLLSCFIYHDDPSPQNIIYDEQENKCWFIDHEHTFISDGPKPLGFHESDFVCWGLKPHVSLGC